MRDRRFDVIIIGGGPAGLSAALMLGRCERRVLLLDANKPRNAASLGIHGYLTQDGVPPLELRAKGRQEILRYRSVRVLDDKVRAVGRDADGFGVQSTGNGIAFARLLLLATGRVDPPPDLPGFKEFMGRGVFHCPYCDGWENRGGRLGAFGPEQETLDLAELLLTWSPRVTVYAGGEPRWSGAPGGGELRVNTSPIDRLEGDGRLERIVFLDGTKVPCDALFFPTPCPQRSDLPKQLGCVFDEEGSVRCHHHQAEGVDGVFVAGNVRGGVHLAITAAAEGAEAAIAMNAQLRERDAAAAGGRFQMNETSPP